MKHLLILLISVLFLNSCDRNNDNTNNDNLIAKWDWVQSTGSISGTDQTPNSTGINRVLEISKNTVKVYENGVLKAEKNYTIQTKNSIYGGEKQMIVYGPNQSDQSFLVEGNKLYLNDECYDCYKQYYIKK